MLLKLDSGILAKYFGGIHSKILQWANNSNIRNLFPQLLLTQTSNSGVWSSPQAPEGILLWRFVCKLGYSPVSLGIPCALWPDANFRKSCHRCRFIDIILRNYCEYFGSTFAIGYATTNTKVVKTMVRVWTLLISLRCCKYTQEHAF